MTEAYRPESGKAQITPIDELTNPYELAGLASLTGTTVDNGVFSSGDGLTFTLNKIRPEAIIDGEEHPIALYDSVLVARKDGIALVVLPDLIDHKTESKPDGIRVVNLVQGEFQTIPPDEANEEIRLARNLANQRRDERLGDWNTDYYTGPSKRDRTEEY